MLDEMDSAMGVSPGFPSVPALPTQAVSLAAVVPEVEDETCLLIVKSQLEV